MKKYISILLSICFLFLFSACGNEADLLKKIETLEDENIRLKEEIADLNEKYVDLPETYLAGYFNATISELTIYPSEQKRMPSAIIHLFQSDPFIVYIDEEIAKTLDTHTVYRFEIERTYIDRKEFPNPDILKHPEIAEPALFLRFKSIEKTTEYGNPCNFLRLETKTEE